MVLRSVRRREIVAWLPERYQKKVFVEEENLQDYQKRREEEKVRNWKLHRENLLRGWRGVLWMSQEWFCSRWEKKAKKCKGLVWKIKFARYFLKYSVISHQFVLLTFCGMCCASKLLDAAEK